MGNKLVTDFIKEKKASLKPEEVSKLGIHAEALQFENVIVDYIWGQLKDKAGFPEGDMNKMFPIHNRQTNEDVDELFMKSSVLQHLNENYTAGFSTSQSNCQMLKENNHDRYFKVHTDADTSAFTNFQQKKYYILYGLFQAKFEGSATQSDFFEYCEKYMAKPVDGDSQKVPQLDITATMIVDLLSPDMLQNALMLYYQRISDMPYVEQKIDQNTFVTDNTLNQTRDFLARCVRNKSLAPKSVDLCLKLILRLGTARSNPEDYLVAITLMNENPVLGKKIDLRAELNSLTVSTGGPGANQVKNLLSEELQLGSYRRVVQELKGTALQDNWACDEENFYILNEKTFFKVGKKERTAKLLDTNDDIGHEKSTMCYLNKKLWVRAKLDTPLCIFDPETLVFDKKATEEIKIGDSEKEITMAWMDAADPKTGRFLNRSPLLTDGNSFYLISLKKHIKSEGAEEDEEGLATALVVECYSTTDFKHIKSTTLFKNESLDIFIPSAMRSKEKVEDYLNEFVMGGTQWITNGTHLLISVKDKCHVFDLTTGIRVAKMKYGETQDTVMFLDNQSNTFFGIKNDDKIRIVQDFIIPAFKQSSAIKEGTGQVQNLSDHFRAAYALNFESPSLQTNVIERIIRKSKQQTQEANLPDIAGDFVKAALLGNTASHCEKFEKSMVKVTGTTSEKEGNYIPFFRFPGATYLTSEMFECLQKIMDSFSGLRQGPKTETNLAAQHCLLYTLQILSANFKALGFCGIKLNQIMEASSYAAFLKAYNSCVVAMIEEGYTSDFTYAPCQALWGQIYTQCQNIIVHSIELIYSDTTDIISNLAKVFSAEYTEKQAENCAFQFQYLSQPDNVKKLLFSDESQIQDLIKVFQTLSKKLTSHLTDQLASRKCFEDALPSQPESLIWSSFFQFQNSLAEQILVQIDQIGARIKQNKAQNLDAKKKKKADEVLLVRLQSLSTTIFNQLVAQFVQSVQQIHTSVLNAVKSKSKEFFNEESTSKFNNFIKKVNLEILTHSVQSINLYIEVMPYLNSDNHQLVGVLMVDCVELVTAITEFKQMLRKYRHQLKGKAEPEDSDDELPITELDSNKLVISLDQVCRRVCWVIGHVSFSYIQVKTPVLSAEDLKKETNEQKMERMLMDSKLLSGGIENHFINQFSQEIREQVRQVLVISGDYHLHELTEIQSANHPEDILLKQIIHRDQNPHIDLLLQLLQFQIIRQQPMVPYASLQGQNGLKCQLAAFAVLIKFNHLSLKFEQLVDEVDQQSFDLEQLQGNQKMQKLKELLNQDDVLAENLAMVQEQWKNASKMRLWLTEKVKNLMSKIGKQKKNEYIESLKKKNTDKTSELVQVKSEQIVAAEPETEQIDTTKKSVEPTVESVSAEEGEEKKEAEEKKDPEPAEEEEEIKLSQDDKDKIAETVDVEFQKRLVEIIQKIVEKAELMLKMQVPSAYKMKEEEHTMLIKKPTYIERDVNNVTEEKVHDWTDKLNIWKMQQQDEGHIKSTDNLKTEMFQKAALSVLACLQSPISVKKIQKRVESVYLSACRRVAGLTLVSKIIGFQDLPKGTISDLTNWFCAGLRNQTNQLTHYLNGIQGCGNHLERQVKIKFFIIYEAILVKLKASEDNQECIRLLDALHWKFRGCDHEMLANIDIFRALRFGNGNRVNLVKRAWGRPLTQKVNVATDEATNLTSEVLSKFERLLLNILSRIVDQDFGAEMQLKQGGTNVPKLERSKSIIDLNASEKLIGQAVEILFKEFDRYIKIMEKFEGVDYQTYVNQRNKEIKNDEAKMEFLEELLMDEEEEEKAYKDDKEAKKKAKEDAKAKEEEAKAKEEDAKANFAVEKQTAVPSEEVKTEDVQIEITDSKETEPKANDEPKVDEVKVPEEDEEDAEEKKVREAEEKKKAEEEADTKVETDAKEKLKAMTEAEIKSIYKLYAENYLQRLLRLIELFASAALNKPHARSMVQRVANPYMIFTLIRLLLATSPRNKMIVVKIIQNLVQLGMPSEIFEKTVEIISTSGSSYALKVLKSKSELEFSSQWLNFFFKYMLDIRKSMWDKQDAQSEAGYEFSQEIANLIRQVLKSQNYGDWKQTLQAVVKEGFLKIESLPEAERDCLFSLQLGADFQRISIGRQAVNNQGQLFTVLGYTQQNMNGELPVAEIEKHGLSHCYSDAKQRLAGLFYDGNTKERQEIIQIPPYDAKPVLDLDSKDALQIAEMSVFMQTDVIKHLASILTRKQPKDDYVMPVSELVLKVQIMKAISCLLQINPNFLTFISQNGILGELLSYLQEVSSSKFNDESKSTEVVPLTWLEAKATNIRVRALESSFTIQELQSSMSCRIIENTQLLFTNTDSATGDQIIQNAFLLAAINLNRVQANTRFTVHMNSNELKTYKAKSKVQNGLVFVEGSKVETLSDEILQVMQSSQAILTHDVNVKDLFARVVAKATEEKSQWQWCLNCVILVVSQDDFEYIRTPQNISKPEWLLDQSKSKVEIFFEELKNWAGIDTSKLMYHFCMLEDKSLDNLKKNLPEIMEKIQKEEQEHTEKLTNFEADLNQEGCETEKKRRADLLAERDKKVQELKSKIFVQESKKSIVQQQVEKCATNPAITGECEIPNLLDEKQEDLKKFLDPVIESINSEDQAASSEDKVKSEEAICKQYLQITTDFPKSDDLVRSYKTVMQKLFMSYAKSSLLDLMRKGDLANLIPSLLKDEASQKQLACFIKSSFNQAILTRKSTGQKTEIRSLKEMLRRLFKFCIADPTYTKFIHKFVFEDIIQAGKITLDSLKAEKPKAVSAHFATEDIAIVQLNPYLLKFVNNILMENSPDWLVSSKTYLPCLFSLCFSFLVKFWDKKDGQISGILLNSALRILFFCQQNLKEFCKSGVLERIVNTPILTRMVKRIDYTKIDSTFSEEQKQLLEVYLGLIHLCEKAEVDFNFKFDKILEMTPGVSEAKRALRIVREKGSFSFLKYYVYHSQLADHQKKLMNETVATQHNHYDVKIMAKYSIDQVERISIKVTDKCDFKPLTFMGISSSADGKDMDLYTKEDLKKLDNSLNFNRAHFYTFYPVKKQMAVAMGEEKRHRTSMSGAIETPQLVMCSKEIKPVQVVSSKNASIILTANKTIYTTGQKWGSDHDEFTLMELAKDEVAKKIFIGSKCQFVLTESGKCFFVGSCKDFCLPGDTSVNKFKEFKLSNDETAEKIVEVSCGNNYNIYVTDKGKVWATGKAFLKKMGLESEVAVQLPLPSPEMFVTRAWASKTKGQNLCIIEVKTGDTFQLYSAGKNDQGLLGQGGKVKESKSFTKLDYNSQTIQFKDISVFADHALAIDQSGSLWAWGSNLQNRSGFTSELADGVYAPTKVPFVEGAIVMRVSAGLDHSLVQAKDANGKIRLYSLGKEESNYKHLGCSKEQASEGICRELSLFNDFEIIDFCASHKYNMILIAGDEKSTDGLYEHKLSADRTVNGMLHAYLKDGKWHFMSSDDYRTNSSDLPDICLAFKCPIKDLEKALNNEKLIPDMSALVDGEVGNHGDVKSTISGKQITGPRYSAYAKINNDMVHVDLTESEMSEPNKFDVNPFIYFRLSKPLKEGQTLPLLDLKALYGQTAKYGFEIEVIPDTSYAINDRLLSLSKDEYKDFCDVLSKFPPNCDREFIIEMNKLLNNLGEKDHKTIEPKTDFDASAMKFSAESKLKKITDSVKRQYLIILWRFNTFFVKTQPYLVNKPLKPFRGYSGEDTSVANLFNEVKHMILTAVKMKFVNNAIGKLPQRNGDYEQVTLKRQVAVQFQEDGKIDHTGEYSLFGQLFQILRGKTPLYECFKVNGIDDQVLRVKFYNEDGIDVGGPYRELVTSLGEELGTCGVLPLLIKSQNNKSESGENLDCYVVDSTSVTPTHQELFEFLGVWVGNAFRTKSCIPINWAPILWKQINSEKIEEADLKSADTGAFNQIQEMRKHHKEYTVSQFNEAYADRYFEVSMASSKKKALCEGGEAKAITHSNLEEYIKLFFEARLTEGKEQVAWIRKGMERIVPFQIVSMLQWDEIEVRVAGEKIVDVERLKGITEYDNCSAQTKQIKFFWNIMGRMSEEDKSLYLRFVWGRSRLPSELNNLRYKHSICFYEDYGDSRLPEAHTCFFMIDLPGYSTEEIMEKRLLTAIQFCGSIENR